MHEYSFPLHALGSDAPTRIEIPDLAAWITTIRGTEVDLISYLTTSLLETQIPYSAIPATGGSYYVPRLLNAFGIADTTLTNAPELNTAAIETDIQLARKTAKTFRISLPSPASLALTDAYYHDPDEYMESITDSYVHLGRMMRDNGAFGCVLLGNTPCNIELERLHGMKYLWSTPVSALETVLEQNRDIVVPGTEITSIAELIDSYAIRNIFIKDADTQSLGTALKILDYDHIFTAGYAGTNDTKTYWKNLSELKIHLADVDL